ncbi:MAG: metallophosphoesterase, partial [Eubacteriales bacterium]|nr:metallophosphoesterase [Eubacteriales bacterium]
MISDIHGCYEEYQRLLEKIAFSEKDELYVLGDAVDRGPEPIRVLQDMMERPGVYPVMGNHDYVALRILGTFRDEATADNLGSSLTRQDLLSCMYWIRDGGRTTVKSFLALEPERRREILRYLESFPAYREAFAGGKRYVLVHGGIEHFDRSRSLASYDVQELAFCRADYDRRY